MLNMPVFVISLPSAKERQEKLKAEFKTHGLNFSFFDAVDGRDFRMDTRAEYNGRKRRCFFGKDLTGGEMGCLLSHRAIYQHMVDKHMPRALIFEDDARLHEDFVDVVKKLDAHQGAQYDLVRFLSSDKVARLKQRKVVSLGQGYSLNRLQTTPGGAHGYLITRNGALKLLKATRRNWRPIDTLIGHVWSTRLNAFIIQPGIVWQDLTLDSSIGADRFNKKYKKSIFRGLYKLWEGIMKRLTYLVLWPYDFFVHKLQ
jgi:glycosyl transferase family 25